VLLRPYFNDRAKALLARCDLEKTGDYKAIKEFLLREMILSPSRAYVLGEIQFSDTGDILNFSEVCH